MAISPGSAGRNRVLSIRRFLALQVPLPSLDEQQRIVARIEELVTKIEEARGLCRQAVEETEVLVDSYLRQVLTDAEGRDDWESGPIARFAEVNPSRRGQLNLEPTQTVTFVPMAAVDDKTGTIIRPEVREFYEVSKGYTWFRDEDVIFARITPCMQNGKAALARDLANGNGFGSTEFHVLRPKHNLMGEWLHALVRQRSFREDAAKHLTGTAGQQRVPQTFLEHKAIPVPPVAEQHKIVAQLASLHARVDALKQLQLETAVELDALLPSVLDKAFKGEL